jgi:hypothetical protein
MTCLSKEVEVERKSEEGRVACGAGFLKRKATSELAKAGKDAGMGLPGYDGGHFFRSQHF